MDLDFSGYNDNNKNNYVKTKFKTGIITCPICNKKHAYWCSVTVDDGLCLCHYIWSERQAKDGRFIHILNNSSSGNKQKSANPAVEQVTKPVAEIERLDAVYSALLKSLELMESHRHNLIKERGMSEESVSRNSYASVPGYEQRFKVAQAISESFDLTDVPGFYKENGKWALNLTYSGFYIPFRDEFGRIGGMQIRRDDISDNKYWWLSSNGKDNGAKSVNPIHIVNLDEIRKYKNVLLTEGALKADVVANFTEVGLVAIGGVSSVNPDNLIKKISESLPDAEEVIVAFDMDWQIRDEVRGAIFRMMEALKNAPFKSSALTWNLDLGKGLDDILKYANDNQIQIEDILTPVSAEEFQQKLLAIAGEKEESPENEGTNTESKSEDINFDMGLKAEIPGEEDINTFGITCRDFLQMELPDPERVMFGVNRATVGMFVSATNIGKTTLALNLSMSAGMNRPFLPLFDENHTGRRTMYIDGEASKSELQADIKKMLESCSDSEREAILDNLCFICEEEVSDDDLIDDEFGYEPLDLVKRQHLNAVIRKAKEFKPDLIIVDTLSALMNVEDENDNAIMKREVIAPMKRLAKKSNAAVLILHHTGKFSEGSQSSDASNKARGASVLGGLSRANFYLNKGTGKYEGKVTLSVPKAKGQDFESVVLELDRETRWFRFVENFSQNTKDKKSKINARVSKKEGRYKKVLNFILESCNSLFESVQSKDIVQNFKGEIDKNVLYEIFEKAIENGDLDKPKYGFYAVTPKYVESNTEMPLEE